MSMFTLKYLHRSKWISIVLAAIIVLLTNQIGIAQEATPSGPTDDEVNAIAKQMYCPVCENIPLDVCPTQACVEWRELIREKLAQGWSETQIKSYFVEQFGDRVLATPPARGLNWFVYIIPPISFLGGVIILYRAYISLRKPVKDSEKDDHLSTSDEYIKRIENEIKNYQEYR